MMRGAQAKTKAPRRPCHLITRSLRLLGLLAGLKQDALTGMDQQAQRKPQQ